MIYIRHCQRSNSQPVPSQVRADPTRPQWRTRFKGLLSANHSTFYEAEDIKILDAEQENSENDECNNSLPCLWEGYHSELKGSSVEMRTRCTVENWQQHAGQCTWIWHSCRPWWCPPPSWIPSKVEHLAFWFLFREVPWIINIETVLTHWQGW